MKEPIADTEPLAPFEFGPFGRMLAPVTKWMAIAGGLVFVALVIMSIISIVGRKLGVGPVPGDVELLQMWAAFASACFFAYCHLHEGDVKVDFFTEKFPAARVHLMDACGSLLVAMFAALIAWRTTALALASKESGETSAVLAWPVWIGQALMVPGFVLLAIAGVYMAAMHLQAREGGTA